MASTGSELTRYVHSLGEIAPLDREQERELAFAAAAGDRRARDRLVRACLPFVISVATGYRAWNVSLEDLVQQGSIGLLKAIEKFDPDRGCRLATYANFWIRAEIRSYVVCNYRAVRLGATATERRAIRAFRTRPVGSVAELAEISGMPLPRAERLWPLLQRGDVALDDTVRSGPAWRDQLADETPTPEQRVSQAQVADQLQRRLPAALAGLSERERRVVRERMMKDEPPTLRELGEHLGLSRERVRQIESACREKLRTALEATAA